MKTIRARAFVLACVLLIFSFPAFGWGETGHKITAYIAWQRMTPQTRERVFKTLLAAPEDSQIATFYLSYGSRSQEARKREFFMLMATWSDIVRDRNFENRYKKYHQSNWHYTDTFWSMTNGKAVLVDGPEPNGQAMNKIAEFSALIRGSAPDSEKAVAIAWLEHLIGDIHQPLHGSGRITDETPKGDLGGNLFLLTPKGTARDKQRNLHSYWDGIIGENVPNARDECDAVYIDPIAQEIMRLYPADKFQGRLKMDAMDQWQKESVEIAMNEVYRDVKWYETPSEAYRKKAFRIAQERLALAGYRMGELFEQVYGPTPSAK